MPESAFRKSLLHWYEGHQRPLPWRQTSEPYRIWLSEIILQQTQVAQGTPYYHRFLEEFPSVYHLAEADEDVVMKLWEGLGYYNRARNLQAAARQVVKDHQGKFPADYQGLLQLKGVGEYTAAAISSFAYNEVQAVVDGNVFRVLSRYFGIDTPINTTKGKKVFTKLANELIDPVEPGQFNQALMEFGALQCRPKNPDCGQCPLAAGCHALSQNEVEVLPVKNKKTYNRERYFSFAMIELPGNQVVVQRRGETDVWRKLYQFPLVEHSRLLKADELLEELKMTGGDKSTVAAVDDLKPHKLSHQTIHCRIVKFRCKKAEGLLPGHAIEVVTAERLKELAFPRPLRKYLDAKQLTLQIGNENF